MSTIWSYRNQAGRDLQAAIIGYDVEAVDGSIGEVTEESTAVGSSHIVVDTGFWILEKKRLIPAGAIAKVDHKDSKIRLDLSKSEIKDAPDYVDASNIDEDPTYRDHVEAYYVPWMML